MYISINILGPRALSLLARRGEMAFTCWGHAPPFQPARVLALRCASVRPLRSGPQGYVPFACRGQAPPFRSAKGLFLNEETTFPKQIINFHRNAYIVEREIILRSK